MNYQESMDFIKYTRTLGSRPGTGTEKKLLQLLGNPQEKLRVVHIAGTNGKGSVFAFYESILRQAGYTVGRYISPAIFTYLERFQINGAYMSEEEFAALAGRVKDACGEMVSEGLPHPTSFEVETATAFLYFSEKHVDVVLLETGMGGRDDATNVVSHPLATVFSSISLDHTAFLGKTPEEIAENKAGIMREGVPVITGVMDSDAEDALCRQAHRLSCPIYRVIKGKMPTDSLPKETTPDQDGGRRYYLTDTVSTEKGSDFRLNDRVYHVSLLGTWQPENAALAAVCAFVLQDVLPVKDTDISQGLENARWPGRMDILSRKPLVIADGAHNPDGVKRLRESIKTLFPGRTIIMVAGIFKDKDHRKMLENMLPLGSYFIATESPDKSRAMSADALAGEAGAIAPDIPCESAPDCNDALKRAVKLCSGMENAMVLVFGSLSFTGRLYLRNE